MQQSIFSWLFSNASLTPAFIGIVAAVIGLIFFVRPSRRGSLFCAFLSLAPTIIGMLLVYDAARDFKEIATDDSVVKSSAILQCVGRGIGTGLFSLFGTSIGMYVALLALLRSWKRNRVMGDGAGIVRPTGRGFTMDSQARGTKGLNAYEPESLRRDTVEGGIGVELDEVIAEAGVGFVPGSPTYAMSKEGQASRVIYVGDADVDPDDDDPSIIDLIEV